LTELLSKLTTKLDLKIQTYKMRHKIQSLRD